METSSATATMTSLNKGERVTVDTPPHKKQKTKTFDNSTVQRHDQDIWSNFCFVRKIVFGEMSEIIGVSQWPLNQSGIEA